MQLCKDCTGPAPPSGEKGQDKCWAVKDYRNWKVSEHGKVRGADNMKAEIFKRGPIACGIDATEKLEEYHGGIFEQEKYLAMENHIISVVGWGVSDKGEEYWIVRNSWGTYWGEEGFFRIRMHKNNLAIERNCDWAVPIMTP